MEKTIMKKMMVLGFAALFLWLGYKIPLFKNKKSKVVAVLLGFLVFTLINIVPIVGTLALFIAGSAAAGAALQTRFGGRPLRQEPVEEVAPTDAS